MNFVKIYEVRICNGFFGIGLSVEADFVNMREGQTSRLFIAPFALWALPPNRESADLREGNWRLMWI